MLSHKKNVFTFFGKIQVHIFEGHRHSICGLEDDAVHNVLLPGGYAQIQALSVGCIQYQVTLGRTVMFKRVNLEHFQNQKKHGWYIKMVSEDTFDSSSFFFF